MTIRRLGRLYSGGSTSPLAAELLTGETVGGDNEVRAEEVIDVSGSVIDVEPFPDGPW